MPYVVKIPCARKDETAVTLLRTSRGDTHFTEKRTRQAAPAQQRLQVDSWDATAAEQKKRDLLWLVKPKEAGNG
jgi:hypothetical protein